MKTPNENSQQKLGAVRRCLRWLKRLGLFFLTCIACYLLVALAGLIPVNNGFRPDPDGIEIWLVSNPIHTDIIVPIRAEKNHTNAIDWRTRFPQGSFQVDPALATHVAIGWGNKQFYINTPTWADLHASTVVGALFWPSASCMHVSLCTADSLPKTARSVKLSAEQYRQLVEYLDKSFHHDAAGAAILIPHASYGPADAFFEADGRYHCFNTCNCWTGRALRTAGIRAGWFTPLPGTVGLWLPR